MVIVSNAGPIIALARMDRDKELYERQIKIVDMQIDRLVYELYGLMEEVKVVK
jgi:hypothetical protein